MDQDTRSGGKSAIGVDLGDRYSYVCVVDEEGNTAEESRLPTSEGAFRRRFEGGARTRVALEAGTHSPWASRLLGELGYEVIVANPRKVRLISESRGKHDRVDAERLARIARLDPRLLCPIQHRGKQAQLDRQVLRARDTLVRNRTAIINDVRGSLKSVGIRVPKCSAEAFPKEARAFVPVAAWPGIYPLLRMAEALNDEIRELGKKIEAMNESRYPETALLRQIPGVGPLTALAFVLTLQDPTRFKRARSVGAYFGLTPRRDQSGDSDPELRITKAGDSDVRRLLVQCAHYILGPYGQDSDLRRFGLELASRGKKNAKKRAVVAVARKLAVLLHHLWRTAEVYEPLLAAGKRSER